MSFIRVQKNKNYTVMSNFHLRDKSLSLKAKGLLSYMLSCSEDWNFSVRGLEAVLKEGRDSIRAGLDELERRGYLIREQIRDNNGAFGRIDYIVFEEPQTNEVCADESVESIENAKVLPCTENPTTADAKTGKPPQRKTKDARITVKKKKDSLPNLSVEQVEKRIKEQIESESFESGCETKTVNNLVSILVEMEIVATHRDYVRIGREKYPSAFIKRQLGQIDRDHIVYILECMKHPKEDIRNIKAYLQTAIINAPSTIDAYYDAEVRHDFGRRG